jgi:hypothetical protein
MIANNGRPFLGNWFVIPQFISLDTGFQVNDHSKVVSEPS